LRHKKHEILNLSIHTLSNSKYYPDFSVFKTPEFTFTVNDSTHVHNYDTPRHCQSRPTHAVLMH